LNRFISTTLILQSKQPLHRTPDHRVSTDHGSYEQLDPDRIVATTAQLGKRIKERFPSAGLNAVADKLLEIARRTKARAEEVDRPNWLIRIVSGVIILVLLAMLTPVIFTLVNEGLKLTATELIQVAEAGLNELVAIGITIFFLVTLETRIKRGRVLQAIHELRVIAHIIDMHQLTKDPERMLHKDAKDTVSSPRRTMTPFELNRYLDYCSEMLSLAGKVAVLYVQNFPDEEAVKAVNNIEDLTSGLSRKIWQKITLLTPDDPPSPTTSATPVEAATPA